MSDQEKKNRTTLSTRMEHVDAHGEKIGRSNRLQDAEGLKEGIGCVPIEASIRRIAAAIRSVNEERRIRESVPDRRDE